MADPLVWHRVHSRSILLNAREQKLERSEPNEMKYDETTKRKKTHTEMYIGKLKMLKNENKTKQIHRSELKGTQRECTL